MGPTTHLLNIMSNEAEGVIVINIDSIINQQLLLSGICSGVSADVQNHKKHKEM